MKLRPYQSRSIDELWQWFATHPNEDPIFEASVGAGKSLMIAEIARRVDAEAPGSRVLVLVHQKELLEQNLDKLLRVWPGVDVGICSAAMGRKSLLRQVTYATIGSVWKHAARLGRIDLVLADECFTAGTMVATPCGPRPIELIAPGDIVFTATGRGEVRAVSKRSSDVIYRVRTSDGRSIRTTANHPFFTASGWVRAADLERGARIARLEDMPALWRDLQASRVHKTGRGHHVPGPSHFREGSLLLDLLLEEGGERDVGAGRKREDVLNSSIDRSRSICSWWERHWADSSAVHGTEGAGPWVGAGAADQDRNGQGERLPDVVQGRLGQHNAEGGDRAGRSVALRGSQSQGSEEGQPAGYAWVESVEAEERGRSEAVFNLDVSGHPSYFADGVLVHNCHLINPKEIGMWRTFISELRRYCPHTRVIGFTGTPFRGNGAWLTADKDALFSAVATRVTMRELIDLGFLAPLKSVATETRIETADVKVSGGDYVVADLAKAADKVELVEKTCDEIVRLAASRRRWLVFAVTVEHAQHVADALKRRGVAAAVVHGATPKAERAELISLYRKGTLRCLVNVAVLTTGFDAPEVDFIALLRATKSPVLYCLDAETEILTSHGWRGIGKISEGDCVLSADRVTGRGRWSRVTGVVRRPMEKHEQWVEYEAPRANFRVTDGHRMLFRTSTFGGGWSEMKVAAALDMAKHRDSIRMPTAVRVETCGVPLTDHELYLVGILMTDGTWTTHQATISQSERHPEILKRIEAALDGAGIAYKKRLIAPPKPGSEIQQRHPRWVYSISMGDPRCGRPGKGLRYMTPYLDNDLAPALMQMTRSQFITLLKAIHDGDGFKQKYVTEWTPSGWSICSVRAVLMDRLQAIAVMHGMTANLRWEKGPSRKRAIGVISINDQDWRSVGGTGNRPQIEVKPGTNEEVWCVESEDGTIVTRRRGKVTVMGNCQIAGRGMRVVGADITESIRNGKADCLWADFTSTTEEMGPVDLVKGREPPKKGKGEAPFRICDNCGNRNHASALVCRECGFNFPEPERIKHDAIASGAAVMGMEVDAKRPTYEVTDVRYRLHVKHDDDGNESTSMRVEYMQGMRCVAKQWVLFDHTGYGRAKAEGWWMQRVAEPGIPVPSTSAEAVDWAENHGALIKPHSIQVSLDGKYPEIIYFNWTKDDPYAKPDFDTQGHQDRAAAGDEAAREDVGHAAADADHAAAERGRAADVVQDMHQLDGGNLPSPQINPAR